MRRTSLFVLSGLLLAGIVLAFTLQGMLNAHSQTAQSRLSADAYLYYTLETANGFVLARALKGANGAPQGLPQTLLAFGDSFGQVASDSVASIQLSPDGDYLVIDGIRDHGEQVWVYDTQYNTIALQPPYVMGNFLHWMSGGNGHTFLYRPMLPLGPQAPMDGNSWNPGLWLVNAATGTHVNIDIHVPSAALVDAASSPDGTRIVYSTSLGLGLGSDVWLMNSDGNQQTHLFSSANTDGMRSIIGLFAWSSDGTQIAYERLVDSSTPFLPAGLWVMSSSGSQQRYLAETDGGHGYWPVWSPDNTKLAYIVRTNVGYRSADMLAQSLQSAIGIVDVRSGHTWLAATPQQTGMQLNLNPTWAATSASVTFTALNPINARVGGTPRYWQASVTGQSRPPAVTPISPVIPHVIAVG